MGRPNVFVEPGPRCVTGGADALEASFITALVNSSALGDGILRTGCIRAKYNLCPSVDMTVREQTTWTKLGVEAHIGDWDNDTGVLHPLRLGFVGFVDRWQRREHPDKFGGRRWWHRGNK